MTQTKTRKFYLRSAIAAFTLIVLASAVVFGPMLKQTVHATANSRECDDECQEELTNARAATAQYHNESKAFEDGFISTFQCVSVPGLGAMGVHYINPARLANPAVDAARPEVLLYLPQADGNRKSVVRERVYDRSALTNRTYGQAWTKAATLPAPVCETPALQPLPTWTPAAMLPLPSWLMMPVWFAPNWPTPAALP